MFRLYTCVTNQHDPWLVGLAALMCVMTCAAALSLATRATTGGHLGRSNWLWAAAIVAGAGIWTTHFVAMLAFRPGLPVGYDPSLTFLSIIVAIVFVRLGFMLAFLNLRPLGGAVMGFGIAAMHFTGMAALQIQATRHWDFTAVTASIVIGSVLGALSFHVMSGINWRRSTSAVVFMVLAIVGMHFTAMSAIAFVPDPTLPPPTELTAPVWLAIAIAAIAALIIGLGMVGSIIDRHLANRSVVEADRLRAHVIELEQTRADLEAMTTSLRAALAGAEAANVAKTRFLATMGHELRTPLNGIIGFAELLTNELFGPLGDENYRDYAASIADSGHRLLRTVSQVLEIAKCDAGDITLQSVEISLAGLIRDTIERNRKAIEKASLMLDVALEPGLPTLLADRILLDQILDQLLSNGIKFTPSAGEVTISAFRRNTELCIAVTDTGIGIGEDDLPRIAERFGQLDSKLARRYEGSGLGLALTKQLVELHGGKLEFQSILGAGTTATIAFPSDRVVGAQQAAA